MSLTPRPSTNRFRVLHRYLGFFLAGIMAVYSLSGIVLIFRKTDFLKREVAVEKQLALNLDAPALGKALKIKDLTVERSDAGTLYFTGGRYDAASGVATVTEKKLPYVLGQMTHLHKATHKDPLFFLNIFFGLSLFFFVVSAFWMFRPETDVFRKGLYFTAGGILLTLLLLFV